jgi:hypothetical protein
MDPQAVVLTNLHTRTRVEMWCRVMEKNYNRKFIKELYRKDLSHKPPHAATVQAEKLRAKLEAKRNATK